MRPIPRIAAVPRPRTVPHGARVGLAESSSAQLSVDDRARRGLRYSRLGEGLPQYGNVDLEDYCAQVRELIAKPLFKVPNDLLRQKLLHLSGWDGLSSIFNCSAWATVCGIEMSRPVSSTSFERER